MARRVGEAPVSTAYPMLSLGYVAVAGISAVWMGEALSVPKVARHRAHLRRGDFGLEEPAVKPFLPFTRPSIDADSIALLQMCFAQGSWRVDRKC